MENNFASLQNLDLGTVKPTPVVTETIEVNMSADVMMDRYAKAFVTEAIRKNPLLMERMNLTAEEVYQYCAFLLKERILFVKGQCPLFRKLKALYIPVWIQYILSCVGRVVIRNRGLVLMPIWKDSDQDLTFEQALAISEKIGSLEDDLQIVQDGMPRTDSGDKDVMSSALIAGYIRSMNEVQHVSATYVAAFANAQLEKETAFSALYRVQYDDLDYIVSALVAQKGIY